MLAYHNDPAIKENGKCFDLVWYWRPRPAPGRVIDRNRRLARSSPLGR